MRSIKKRAYVATVLIILALAGLAYYANEQVKKLNVDFKTDPNYLRTYNPEPPPTTDHTPPPPTTLPDQPNSVVQSPTTTKTTTSIPKTKKQNIITQLHQTFATAQQIETEAGTQINLLVSTNKAVGQKGYELTLPNQEPIIIGGGLSKTVSFKATEDVEIPVTEEDSDKILYTIKVDVK